MKIITCISDFKPLYRRRMPKMLYDCAEYGGWSEQTFRENTCDFWKPYLR